MWLEDKQQGESEHVKMKVKNKELCCYKISKSENQNESEMKVKKTEILC